MSDWYILYVGAGKEDSTRRYLNNLIKDMGAFAFSPKSEKYFRGGGRLNPYVLANWIPGHIFVETDAIRDDFILSLRRADNHSRKIYNLLGKNYINFVLVPDDEKEFLKKFMNDKFIVTKSVGVIVDHRFVALSGVLKGYENLLKPIKHEHKHDRYVELEMVLTGTPRVLNFAIAIDPTLEEVTQKR